MPTTRPQNGKVSCAAGPARPDGKLKRDEKRGDKLGHYDTWDALVPGLGVRTSATGRRTFVLVARYPGSRNPTRRALGVYGRLTLGASPQEGTRLA